jgi:hypothetical protein
MQIQNNLLLRAALILTLCLLNIGFGLYAGQQMLVAGGSLGACFAMLMFQRALRPSLNPACSRS